MTTNTPCGFPTGDCQFPQPRIVECRECSLQLVNTDVCSACHFRKMTAAYGARMQYFSDCLKHVAENPGNLSSAEIEAFIESKLSFYGNFNLLELFADCLLILYETQRLFTLIVAHEIDFPADLEKEVVSHTDVVKLLIEKYQNLEN